MELWQWITGGAMALLGPLIGWLLGRRQSNATARKTEAEADGVIVEQALDLVRELRQELTGAKTEMASLKAVIAESRARVNELETELERLTEKYDAVKRERDELRERLGEHPKGEGTIGLG